MIVSPGVAPKAEHTKMYKLYDAASGESIGTLTEAQLGFLIDQLEEESATDRDYYINRATLDMFENAGADPALA